MKIPRPLLLRRYRFRALILFRSTPKRTNYVHWWSYSARNPVMCSRRKGYGSTCQYLDFVYGV